MNFRRALFASLPLAWLLSGPAVTPLAAAPAARLHWLGLSAIGADPNAAPFLKVWSLPQTAALTAQTLDQVSRRPAAGQTNAATALLRPLLDDLIASESFVELDNFTNSQLPAASSQLPSPICQFYLALRLPADRARLWQTNLAAAASVLPGVALARAGDWTLVGRGADTNLLQSEFAARLTRLSAPATHDWFTADLDLPRLAAAFPSPLWGAGGQRPGEVGLSTNSQLPSPISHLLSPISRVHLTVAADAGNLLTRATVDCSRPLALKLPAWEIPTNFMRQPISSFTAVRGFGPWLAALPGWQALPLAAPDQAFFWLQSGIPFEFHFAAPLPGATNQLAQLAGRLIADANPWLATHAEGQIQWQTNPPALVWKDAFMLSPELKPVVLDQREYILGGLVPLQNNPGTPPPAEFFRVLANPALLYYQVEQTGFQIDGNLLISQLIRLVFHQAQLPPAVTGWLKSAAPLLGNCTTAVTQTGPAQLTVTRSSTFGFTALELDLLGDWLASPQFPRGLHTLLAPPAK